MAEPERNTENPPVVGLTAVIVAVTDEVPRVLVVRRVHDSRTAPRLASVSEVLGETPDTLPFGPFDPRRHRTLELGLRSWVEEQTGLPLRYVEQLYTFADQYRDDTELLGGPRTVSVGYIALVRQAPLSGTGEARWEDWYDFLPWEDWRTGRPRLINDVIRPELERWIALSDDESLRHRRRQRLALSFGRNDSSWDFERTLERFELLYEAGMVVEALRDRLVRAERAGEPVPTIGSDEIATARRLGTPMAVDARRILATALGRLRGKLRYRPVVFDLMAPEFTLFQIQRAVEALAGVRLHKQNFRRLLINGGLVEPTGRRERRTGGRPAEQYRFRQEVLSERAAPGVGIPAVRTAE